MRRRDIMIGAAAAACSSTRLQSRVVDSAELFFAEAGSGTPMILIHGGLQDYRLWVPLMAPLAAAHRVIAYSRRNHFPGITSPDGAPDGAADLHAVDLAGLMDSLGIPAANIVAHSAGAHAALFFAHAHPDRVVKLVINEPPAARMLSETPEDQAVAGEFAATLNPAREAFRTGRIDDGLRLFADAVGGPGEYGRRSAAERRRMRDNADAHIADSTTSRPRPAFTSAMARQVAAPTLLTSGSRSPVFFQRIVDRLEAAIPNVSSLQIDGASHAVPSEAPERFAQAVMDFCGTTT